MLDFWRERYIIYKVRTGARESARQPTAKTMEQSKMELKIEHLHLQFFGHEETLHDVSLRCKEGVSVIYGETGSGKTALLKCVAGINDYAGDITLDGAPLALGKEGDVGMVFDDLALFKRRSLYYNLTYPLRLRKLDKRQWQQTISPVLGRWGLGKTILDNPTYRASREVQVRLTLARANLTKRKVLLLDNPLGGLSPDIRQAVFWELSQYLRHYEGVVLYATDDIDEVRSLQAPTAVLSGGYLLAYDAPQKLAAVKPSVYVASRLIPFWRVESGVSEGGVVHTDIGDWRAAYPASYENKRLLVGFAPADWLARETADGGWVIVNTLYADGKTYAVAANAATEVVLEGAYPIGTTVDLTPYGMAVAFDPAGEWRIGKEGE